MPKLKTHSGTKDRIRLTKNGKAVYRHAAGSHFLQKKSMARKRRIATSGTLTGKSVKIAKLKLGK